MPGPSPVIVAVCFGIAMRAFDANAAAMMQGDMEAQWNALLEAPIHVQAEIVSSPVASFGPWFRALGVARATLATCAADAVVRSTFAGGTILPAGTRFRFTWGCYGSGLWYIHGHAGAIRPNGPGDRVDGYVRGELVELVLSSTPRASATALAVAGRFGMKTISAITSTPAIVPQDYPSWYDKQFAPKGAAEQKAPWWLAGHVELPAPFPTTSATVTYASSTRPGGVFTVTYDAPMQRTLIDPADGTGPARIEDPAIGVITWIDKRSRTYKIENYVDLIYDASIFQWPWEAAGTSFIAGLACTNYTVVDVSVAAGQKPLSVCMTKDGLRLRVSTGVVTNTAISVVKEGVSPSASLVPDGFKRVPADDDRVTLRPPPMPID